MAQSDRMKDVQPAPPDAPNPPAGDAGTAKADAEERHRRISEAAYHRAQQRGFTPGQEHDDWLSAEQELDRGTPTDRKPEETISPARSKRFG